MASAWADYQVALRLQRIHADGDLTLARKALLEYLLTHDGSLTGQVAKAMGIKPSTIGALTHPLATLGYITRNFHSEHDDGDRRTVTVHLTDKGRTAAQRATRD